MVIHMNRIDERNMQNKFLEKFNLLEKYLRLESKTDFDESKYRKNLENSNNRLIRTPKYKDNLILAGKIRNIIAHNNEVIFSTQSFLNDFVMLVDKIITPKPIFDVMIPKNQCLFVDLNQTLFELSSQMKINKITTVPILENNKVIGVFSETSLFQSLIDEEGNIIHSLKESKFKNFSNVFQLNSNTYFSYKFIGRDSNVYECLEYFENGFTNNKRLELIFVTENGSHNGNLLGIVSIFDLSDYVN